MIVNELKSKLPSNWRNLFYHHDSYPESFYDVGTFKLEGKEVILVLNRITEDIMEYYYDDLDNSWIDLIKLFKVRNNLNLTDSLLNSKEGLYFINKNYEVLNKKTNSIRKLVRTDELRGIYPRIIFINNKKTVKISNHVIIATIFVPNPNPDIRIIVNHKDLDKNNFLKENLSWETISTNSKKENKKPIKSKYEWREIDSSGNIINIWTSKKDINNLSNQNNKIVKIDVLLENYKKLHPIKENEWYVNKFIKDSLVEANSSGILRINGKETIGNLSEDTLVYYLSIKEGNKYLRYLTHRLIYETIVGKRIDIGNVIDHIIPVRSIETINNEIFNLREVSPKQNSNNINTLLILGEKCNKYDLLGNFITSYNSISEAIIIEKNKSIKDAINNRILSTEHKFLWCKEKNYEIELNNKLRFIYYKYNSDGIILSAGIHLTDLITDDSFKRKNKIVEKIRRNYLNTGIKFVDGFYYQQGFPNKLLYNEDFENNNSLIEKRREIIWKYDK